MEDKSNSVNLFRRINVSTSDSVRSINVSQRQTGKCVVQYSVNRCLVLGLTQRSQHCISSAWGTDVALFGSKWVVCVYAPAYPIPLSKHSYQKEKDARKLTYDSTEGNFLYVYR
jgi:hypothetical protein